MIVIILSGNAIKKYWLNPILNRKPASSNKFLEKGRNS